MRSVLAILLFAASTLGAAAQEPTRQLADAYNASGQQIYAQLAAKPGNIVLSPLSIGTAMAMALAGARGDTEAEMLRVLQHQMPRPQIDAANGALMKALDGYEKNDPPAKLAIANALMIVNGDDISSAYAALARDNYGAEVFAHAGLDEINGWVSRKTDGKIPKILDQLDPRAAAVLLDAVYFKAQWASTFARSATKNEPFNLSASSKAAVPIMHRTDSYSVVERGNYRAVLLPYDVPRLGMIVVLPDAVDGLANVEQQFGADELATLSAAIRDTPATSVALALPRFKTKYTADLKAVFETLGLHLPFGDKADFSGMTGRPPAERRLQISDVVHRALIDVMEDGTEAAAATAVVMRPTMARPQQEEAEPFRVDRPFLFFITDRASGAVLFQGRVVDPR